jgi:hypothetical protein
LPVDPTEVYELYFTCLEHLSRFPIGSDHARLEPYRIWAPVGEGGERANRERREAASRLDECRLLLLRVLSSGGIEGGEPTDSSQSP